MKRQAVVELDVWGAYERQQRMRDNLLLIIKHERNVSAISRRLGISRWRVYDWLKGGTPRLPLMSYIIEDWAEQLKRQSPQSSQ